MAPGSGGGHGEMGGPGLRGGRGGDMMRMRLASLDLSAEQGMRVREIRSNAQKEMIPKQAQVKVMRLEVRELIAVAEPNRGAIEAKVSQIAEAEKELHLLRINTLLQVRSLLTPEQLEKFLAAPWGEQGEHGERPGRPARRPMRHGR
jgi:Spy/CpxP family protein refolding chaperone